MKNKKLELDVDFIGGQVPLTRDEEIAISNYIREYKEKHFRKQPKVGKKRIASARRQQQLSV
jgi:hypothetical protein